MGDVAGLGRRARLDTGTLGIIAVTVDSARQAIALLRRGHGDGLTMLTADEIVIEADTPQIAVGIDGETVMMPAPVRCAIRPGALRVRVPRNRPGVPPPRPAVDWSQLAHLASFRSDGARRGAAAGIPPS
jgi:diacylglycerol kinase family enzyme